MVPLAVPSLSQSDESVPPGVDSMSASFPSKTVGSAMVPSNVATSVVPAVVPLVAQSVSVGTWVTKKTLPLTVVKSLGGYPNELGERTAIIAVPAAVPSVFQSSVWLVPSVAAKTMVLPSTANASGMFWKSASASGWEANPATALVPATVPLVCQSALEPAVVAAEK